MKRSTLTVIVLVIAALGVGGLFALANRPNEDGNTSSEPNATQNARNDAGDQQQENTPDSPEADTNEIEIEDFAFGPISTTVKKGTTVSWTNKDNVQHNVVPDEGDSDAFQGGPLLSKNASYSFTFNTTGTYTYHCGPHPNMTGTVIVTE